MDSVAFDTFAQELLGRANVLKIPTDCEAYEQGWRYGKGKAFRVVRPGSIEEISQLLAYCSKRRIAVVPQGGNTGLVGASVPDMSANQVVLSLSRLNKYVHIDKDKKQVRVSAGVVLDALNDMLEVHGLWLPIDIGSSGSAQVGGIIATNAAGTRAGRYGNVKSRLLCLKVVLADGRIEVLECSASVGNLNKLLLQDNSKLDENNPFCGTSGWLGVVVEAAFTLEALPKGRAVALLLPSTDVDIDELVGRIKQDAGKNLSALEGMADEALHLVAQHVSDLPYLFADEALKADENRYALLVEFSSTEEGNEALQAKLEALLIRYLEEGLLQTARADKPSLFWKVRHAISESLKSKGDVIACDIATPFGQLAAFRKSMNKVLKTKWPFLHIIPFGHEMQAACHYNIVWPKDADRKLTDSIKEEIKGCVYKALVNDFSGTYSAEHGIGPYNQHYYNQFTDASQKALAKRLKLKYDAHHILNPNVHFD